MAAKSQHVPERFEAGWLTVLDGRTEIAKHMRERWQAFTDDLGGADRMSYAERSLAERALWLEYWLASQERELAAGNDFDVGRWTQAANALHGILSKLGLERRTREVQDLSAFLASRESKP